MHRDRSAGICLGGVLKIQVVKVLHHEVRRARESDDLPGLFDFRQPSH